MPVSGVARAVVGRAVRDPNVDVAEVPFTLDYPAYNWFGLGSGAGRARRRRRYGVAGARLARDRVAEVVVPDDPRQDAAWGDLVNELVRQGVTSTALAVTTAAMG